MPKELLGTWCRIAGILDTEFLQRKCVTGNEQSIRITPDGFGDKKLFCKIQDVTREGSGRVYRVAYQCRYIQDTEKKDRPLKQTLRLLTKRADLSAIKRADPDILLPVPKPADPLVTVQ